MSTSDRFLPDSGDECEKRNDRTLRYQKFQLQKLLKSLLQIVTKILHKRQESIFQVCRLACDDASLVADVHAALNLESTQDK